MRTKTIALVLMLLGVCLAVGCVPETPSPQWLAIQEGLAGEEMEYRNGMVWPAMTGPNETIMTPGMSITAKTDAGEITINAGEGFERSYTWDGATRSVKLWERKTRWLGNLGIYYPGPGQHWKSNNGITRGVLQEGILWFKTAPDAVAWINKHNASCCSVYSSQGLVVSWGKTPERKQLNVDVWQVYVDGQKPKQLEGSDNARITVTPNK